MAQFLRLELLLTFACCYFLFLLPGCFLTSLFFPQREDKSLLVFLFSAFVGYLTFWMYFLNAGLGCCFSWLILSVSFFSIKATLKLIRTNPLFKFVFWVGAFYTSLIFIVEPTISTLPEWIQQRFISMGLPGDNIIPSLFSEHLYQGTDPRQLFGDWLSSDRPPLQAGILLMYRPLLGWLSSYYTSLGIVAQLIWVVSLVWLCIDFKVEKKKGILLVGMCIFSGFSWSNSVFVWPKLLAAGLTLFSLHFLVLWGRSFKRMDLILAAISLALGMMSHGGVVFSLPLLVFAGFKALKEKSAGEYLISCSVTSIALFCVLVPWWGYSHFYNPPGDRLIKYHLAEVRQPDPRPAFKTIVEEYQKLDWSEIFYNKAMNVVVLFTQKNTGLWRTPDDHRLAEFRYFFRTPLFLNLGWFILLYRLFSGKRKKDSWDSQISLLLYGGCFCLLFWCLLMFGPGKSYVWQGSYANNLIFFLALGMSLTYLRDTQIRFLLLLQFAFFLIVWVLPAPLGHSLTNGGVPNWYFIATALFSLRKICSYFSLRPQADILLCL